MLTDEQWALFGPLTEACRPPAKVTPQSLRQTMAVPGLGGLPPKGSFAGPGRACGSGR